MSARYPKLLSSYKLSNYVCKVSGLAEVIAELRDEGVRVTAYVNPYLNVKGDIFTQNENEQIWLTDDQGETLIQDFGQFKVKIVKATV